MPDPSTNHDIIIVGGGSAGAVLAARLSEDPHRRVLLLEAGPVYPPADVPVGLSDPASIADPAHDWGYTARGGPSSPVIAAQRGRVLGGSSAVNATCATRARPLDLAQWARYGVDGWSYDEVLPAFKRLENTPTGEDYYHGRTGPLSVRQRSVDDLTPSLMGFIDAGVAQGFRPIDDFNGAEQNGVGGQAVTVADGIRQSTALAYLTADVRNRANLTIVGDTLIDRVVLEGDRAVGVLTADGATHHATEIILSGGTYGSAEILLRSGIGPAADLRALDIDVVADLPVGLHLHDQPFFHAAYALDPAYLQMTPVMGSLLWTASSEAIGDELDIHVTTTHLMPGSLSPTGGAIVLATAVVKPDSRGTLRLASRDPNQAPVIDNNYLASDRDLRRMIEGVRIARDIGRNDVFAKFATELFPESSTSDDALAQIVLSNLAVYGHPTGTVPMGGPGNPWAVVDSVGAVHGIDNLRVVDASIMPELPSTVTNLTTIMIAERIFERVYDS